MRRSLYLSTAVIMGAVMGVQAPALAETPAPTPTPTQSGQSVLMRRPLDIRTTGGTPVTTPTPTPTPGGTPTPTPPLVEPEFPTVPTKGTVAYGYQPFCPADNVCFRVTVTDDNGSYDSVPVSQSFCQQPQSTEAMNLAAWAGLIPGGSKSPADTCSSPNNIYGWAGFCSDGSMFKQCIGIDASSPTLVATIQPESSCSGYVPVAGAVAIMAKLGLMTTQQFQEMESSCGSGGPGGPGPGGPNPGDVPGMEDDPTLHPQDPPSEGGGFYEWEAGEWTGGGQCGVQSTMTRTVRCVKYSWGEPEVLGAIDDGTVNVSFSGEAPKMSRAVWDSSSKVEMSPALVRPGDVKAGPMNAQFEGGMEGEKMYVEFGECTRELGWTPANKYTGTQANCEYEKEKVSDGTWTHPYGGSPTCSSDAIRFPEYRCVNKSTGEEVALGVCIENLKTGGVPDTELMMPERGNYSGCTAAWETESYEIGCHESMDPNSPQGPILLKETHSRCVRSDGTVLEGIDEAACAASDRPLDGIRNGGSCYKTFDQSVHDGICYGHKPGGYSTNLAELDSWRTVVFQGSMYSGGAKACVESGAVCCQERFNYTTRQVETVGSSKPIKHMHEDYAVYPGERGIYGDDGVGPIQSAGTVTYPAGSDERVLDHASPVRILGDANGRTCPYPVGTVMAGCGSIDFMCRTEPGYEGWPPPLMKCNPSTMYYQYEQMPRLYTQGGSGVKWSSQPPGSGN